MFCAELKFFNANLNYFNLFLHKLLLSKNCLYCHAYQGTLFVAFSSSEHLFGKKPMLACYRLLSLFI